VRGFDVMANGVISRRIQATLAWTDTFVARDVATRQPLLYRPHEKATLQVAYERHAERWGGELSTMGTRFAPSSGGQVVLPSFVTATLFYARVLSPHCNAMVRLQDLGSNHLDEDVLGYPRLGPTLAVRVSFASSSSVAP
jgi:hypothetical protein